MAETKDKKPKMEVVSDNSPAATPSPKVAEKAPPKYFIITEEAVNVLLSEVTKLPWIQANPLITLLQQNLKEVKSEA